MPFIEQTLLELDRALKEGACVQITLDGRWERRWWLTNKLRHLFARIGLGIGVENANRFAAYLMDATIKGEKGLKAPTWDQDLLSNIVSSLKKDVEPFKQKEDGAVNNLTKTPYLNPKELVKINKIFSNPQETSRARHACTELDRSLLMSTYLRVSQEDLQKNSPDPKDLQWLEQELEQWKSWQFPPVDDSNPLPKLRRCCLYKEFVSTCRENKALLHLFFHSLIRNTPEEAVDAVDIFIQAPAIQKQLQRTALDQRIHAVGTAGLKFVETQDGNKDVQLLADGRFQSIANPSHTLTLSNTQLQIDDIFNRLIEHNERAFQDIEYLQNGLSLFDSRLPHIDTLKPRWWEQLPIICKRSLEELEKKYGCSLKKDKAVCALCASRAFPDFSAQECHAWVEMAIPLHDGTFNIISVGMFAELFPHGLWETLQFAFGTYRADIITVDPNSFLTIREKTSVALPQLSEEKFSLAMELIGQEIDLAKQGQKIFQVQGENCASFVRTLARKLHPELNLEPFKTPFEKIDLPTFLMPVIWARLLFPNKQGWHAFRIAINRLLGAGKGYLLPGKHAKLVRLLDNEAWRLGILQMPPQLFSNREELSKKLSAARKNNNP